jgi:hypothetical protein
MNTRIALAALLATLLPLVGAADPLHPIANDAYWHHESNLIFPAQVAGFIRVGAPQELDGTTTVSAYYAQGDGANRLVVQVLVFPEGAGWRVTAHSSILDDDARLEALIAAFPLERLGKTDTRCPNAGCGD